MNMELISFTCAPVLLLYAWMAAEVIRTAICRWSGSDDPASAWSRIVVLALRPWACWAIFNLFCRARKEHGFGNPLTFPLYANPWQPHEAAPSYVAELLRNPEFWIWSIVLVFLAGVCVTVGRIVIRGEERGRRQTGLLLGLLCLIGFALWTTTACLPRGARVRAPDDPGSYLLVWHTAGGTFLYNMPHIKSTGHFLRNFEQIQPRLRHTIHGVSHPPGAALSLYWIGKMTGATPEKIRENGEKVRYALGLTGVAALNVAAVFVLAWGLFRSIRIGLLAAILWLTSPAATAYATFSQDVFYALLFHLALAGTWFSITGKRRVITALGLGTVFFALTMTTYSWCIVTAMFAAFAIFSGIRNRWSGRDILVRGVLPLAVMAALGVALLLVYRLDYLAIYRFSHDYHNQWYRFTGAYQWLAALVGGQLEMLLMMGTVAASLCAGLLARLRSRRELSSPAHFLVVVLAIYAIPVVFGPNPLKMETSRCWIWVLSMPVAFAAREIMRAHRPVLWLAGAVTASLASSYIMRIFINFGS